MSRAVEDGRRSPLDVGPLASASAASRAVVLSSGGIDSTTLLLLARHRGFAVSALHVSYGQPAAQAEWKAAHSLCDELEVPLQRVIYSGSVFHEGEIRGRNAFLLQIALLEFVAPSGVVLIGIHSGTGYRDCTTDFLALMQRVYGFHTGGVVELEAPFVRLDKADVVRLAVEYDVPLERTYSCEAANEPCLRCESCLDRQAMLK